LYFSIGNSIDSHKGLRHALWFPLGVRWAPALPAEHPELSGFPQGVPDACGAIPDSC